MSPSKPSTSVLLPVLDVRGGQVVHAVAGDRARYQPLRSRWTSATTPQAVADALHRQFGFTQFYLADLDGLERGVPDRSLLTTMTRAGWPIWLDAGVRTLDVLAEYLRAGAFRVILASECLGPEDLRDLARRALDPAKLVFSLDLRHGTVVSPDASWRGRSPIDVVAQAAAVGIDQVIVLDLAAVGLGQGPQTTTRCAQILARFPRLHLISGGGVRSWADVEEFRRVGVERVLVASALHRGALAMDVGNASDSIPKSDDSIREG